MYDKINQKWKEQAQQGNYKQVIAYDYATVIQYMDYLLEDKVNFMFIVKSSHFVIIPDNTKHETTE